MDVIIEKIKTVETHDNGSLSFFESVKDIPFEIKRFYYIWGVPSCAIRGGHAHKTLHQFIFCPYGKILISLFDGSTWSDIVLDTPNKGILITSPLWRNMVWQQDNSVLCIAASDYFTESDYIRNMGEFLEYISNNPMRDL